MNTQEEQPRNSLFSDCYLLFPKPNEIVQIADKLKVRKIFEGQVEYDEQEIKELKEYDQFLKTKSFKSIDEWTEPQKLRMLYANKHRFDKTLNAMIAYTNWKASAIPPKEYPEAIQFLRNGAIYLHGRDNRFRPIMIVNALKLQAVQDIQLTLDAFTIFLEFVLANYMLPGQIENWVVVMDLGGLGITSLPKQQLQRILEYLQNNYRSRMHKCYIVNCPKTITFSWNIVKPFLEEITVKKISFERGGTAQGIFSHCHPTQIEIRYGGRAQDKSDNFWPPHDISTQYFLDNEDSSQILISQLEYQQMHEKGRLNNNLINQELLRLNQSQQKTTDLDKLQQNQQQEQQEPEDALGVINEMLTQHRNQYYPQQQQHEYDEYEVKEQEDQIQSIPKF